MGKGRGVVEARQEGMGRADWKVEDCCVSEEGPSYGIVGADGVMVPRISEGEIV